MLLVGRSLVQIRSSTCLTQSTLERNVRFFSSTRPEQSALESGVAECLQDFWLAFGEMRPTFKVGGNNDCLRKCLGGLYSFFRSHGQVKRADFRNFAAPMRKSATRT